MSSYYRQQLETWLKTIDVKADRVLDIGGSANPVKGRVRSWNVEEYKIMDNSAEESYHDKWTKPDYFHDINDNYDLYKGDYIGIFDNIFMLEVMEYVWDPVEVFSTLQCLLKDKGVLYITFPSIYPVHNPVEIDSLRYTQKVIEKYLKMFGFRDWIITPRMATEGLQHLSSFYSSEKMHPVKRSPLPFHLGYLVRATK